MVTRDAGSLKIRLFGNRDNEEKKTTVTILIETKKKEYDNNRAKTVRMARKCVV